MTEDRQYLEKQLITCIGNKRKLTENIVSIVKEVLEKLGREKIAIFDAFSGSGVVARHLKQFSKKLVVNDLELYSKIINQCYLANRSQIPLKQLHDAYDEIIKNIDTDKLESGIIAKHYAPADDNCIKKGERVFYTNRNARYIDTARTLINQLPPEIQPFFIAPLLSEASIHTNTAGVFKGFYKDAQTGIGKFGGTREHAISRIKGDIHLPFPVFSHFECTFKILNDNANQVAKHLQNIDLTYIDPPYNQHPYGSNYFMLNLIADFNQPSKVSKVSGIPADWNRSDYYKKSRALDALCDLIKTLDSRFFLISLNSEGFIAKDDLMDELSQFGHLELTDVPYNAFRGSRNLGQRNLHVIEYLILVEKKS